MKQFLSEDVVLSPKDEKALDDLGGDFFKIKR